METLNKIKVRLPELNKQNDLRDYYEQIVTGDFRTVNAVVTEEVFLKPRDYDEFTTNLLAPRAWLDGKGGCDSDADMGGKEEKDWTEKDWDLFRSQAYTEVIQVQRTDGTGVIYVDPQGHNYARYVGF